MEKPAVLGLVSFTIFPAEMGGQKFVADYYLSINTHTRLTLCTTKQQDAVPIGLDIVPLLFHHRKAIFNIVLIKKLVTLIRTRSIDIVLIDHSYLGWIGFILKKITGTPYIIKSANVEFQRFKELRKPWWRIYKVYEGFVHRHAAHSFFITAEEQRIGIDMFAVEKKRSSVLPYAAPIRESPTNTEKQIARRMLCDRYSIAAHTILVYFNGTLDYPPNSAAINWILQQLIPAIRRTNNPFIVCITGNRALPEQLELFIQIPEIRYEGFVANTAPYHMGTDCFICPVETMAGIKTKMVDALAYAQPIVCTPAAAIGFETVYLDTHIKTVSLAEAEVFAAAVIHAATSMHALTPTSFYEKHNRERIVAESLLSLKNAVTKT